MTTQPVAAFYDGTTPAGAPRPWTVGADGSGHALTELAANVNRELADQPAQLIAGRRSLTLPQLEFLLAITGHNDVAQRLQP